MGVLPVFSIPSSAYNLRMEEFKPLRQQEEVRQREMVPGGLYRHCEGLTYRVKGIAPGLNVTGYEQGRPVKSMVEYEQLEDGEYPAGTVWYRDEDDFLGQTEKDGAKINIFELISDQGVEN